MRLPVFSEHEFPQLDNILKSSLELGLAMHEWALAEAVISAVSEVAGREHLKEVTDVKIRVGELQQIELEILEFALSELRTPILKNAQFTLKKVKAKFKCRSCGQQWIFDKEKLDENTAEAIHFVPEVAHTFIRCPKCHSPDFETLEGRGVWLESIRGAQ